MFLKRDDETSKSGEKWKMECEVQCSEVKWSVVKWRKVRWSEVKLFGEMCILSLIYSYVAEFSFCVVRCLIIICFSSLISNYSNNVF